MRKLPDSNSKNPTAAVVYWFYTEILGRKPDASMYARHLNKKNPKAIVHLLCPESDLVASYKPDDLGELIYYLIDNGVEVNDVSIVTITGLAYNYVNRRAQGPFQAELDRTVEWLKSCRGGKSSDSNEMYTKFTGWGG